MALGGGKGFGPKGARGEGGGGIGGGGGGGGGKTKGAGAFSDAGYANRENTGYRAGAQVGGMRGPGSSVSTGGLGGKSIGDTIGDILSPSKIFGNPLIDAIFSGMMPSPISAGLFATRAIQGLTGDMGVPTDVEGMGRGGATGTSGKGGNNPLMPGYQLPQGYMGGGMTPTSPATPQAPQGPYYGMLNQGPQWLSPTPGYGVGVPGYSFFGPMKR